MVCFICHHFGEYSRCSGKSSKMAPPDWFFCFHFPWMQDVCSYQVRNRAKRSRRAEWELLKKITKLLSIPALGWIVVVSFHRQLPFVMNPIYFSSWAHICVDPASLCETWKQSKTLVKPAGHQGNNEHSRWCFCPWASPTRITPLMTSDRWRHRRGFIRICKKPEEFWEF